MEGGRERENEKSNAAWQLVIFLNATYSQSKAMSQQCHSIIDIVVELNGGRYKFK